MNRYALFVVRIERGVKRLVAMDEEIYKQYLDMEVDESEYENYEFVGIVETEFKTDELLDMISEASYGQIEYYRSRLLNIAKIIQETRLN